jgi:hypothetical protein
MNIEYFDSQSFNCEFIFFANSVEVNKTVRAYWWSCKLQQLSLLLPTLVFWQVNMLRERNKSYGAINFVDISSKDYSPKDNQGLDYETVRITF